MHEAEYLLTLLPIFPTIAAEPFPIFLIENQIGDSARGGGGAGREGGCMQIVLLGSGSWHGAEPGDPASSPADGWMRPSRARQQRFIPGG